MGSLLIVTGPPGAGKSTVSARLATLPDRSMLVEGDAFFGFLANGRIDPWLPESHEQNTVVTRAAAAATGVLARSDDTIYDGVLGPWFLPTFLPSAGLDVVDYAVLLPDVARCLERVRGRRDHDFHDEDAARRMHESFAGATIPERHVIDSTTLDVDATVERVLTARAAGDLRLLARDVASPEV